MNSSDHVQLMDTTLRDGEQTRDVSFSTSEKVSIAKGLLGSLRVDRIEVALAGVSAGEQEAVARTRLSSEPPGSPARCPP